MSGHIQTTKTQQQAALLPVDSDAALLEITKNIKSLADIYIEETKALNDIDNKRFLELQEEKLIIARQYQNNMGQMLERKDEIKRTSPNVKKTLQEIHEEFQEISRKNMEALARMQRATEKLGNTLRNAAIRDAHKKSGYSYSEDGKISSKSTKKAVSSGLSETV